MNGHTFLLTSPLHVIKVWQIAILRDDMKLKEGHAIREKHCDPEDIFQERLTYASGGVKVLGRVSTSNILFILLISLK